MEGLPLDYHIEYPEQNRGGHHDAEEGFCNFCLERHNIKEGKMAGAEEEEEHRKDVEDQQYRQGLVPVDGFFPGTAPENEQAHEDEDADNAYEHARSTLADPVVTTCKGDIRPRVGNETVRVG
jgi:hypothetical protein